MMSGNKVSLLCRYGGNLVEEGGKVSYKDGTNRMIPLGAQEINYPRLLSKVREVCKCTNIGSIKYKHPELGLDCLVSVENDEDLCDMMQALETQNNGPIQLFVSEAKQTLPIHNTIPSHIWSCIDDEIAVLTEDNRGGRKEMPLQNNSNMDVNAETAGMPTDLQVGVDELGMDSHDLPTSNPIAEYGCANNKKRKLEEGQEFPNANDFHKFLRDYAIRSNFEYKRSRSGHGYFAAKCIKKDCSWRIQASQISDSQPAFKIKSLKGKHTCNLDKQFKVSHYQATRKWIADFVEHGNYFQFTPKDIADAIEKEYGIHVGYHKAWRGRELARKRKDYIGKSRQECANNYNYIEKLCEDIRRTNPESRVNLQSKSTENNHLKLFISYEAAVIPVFQMACKPLVRLISVKSEAKRPFFWFMAVGVDTDRRNLLLACGFIELDHKEDLQDGYKWFCSELFNVLGGRLSNLVFIIEYSDGGGALEVVRAIFPHSHCRYNEGSFVDGILNKFNKLSLQFLANAKEARKQSQFEKWMSEMYEQCPEAWEFLRNINPEYWATSHFKGAYGDDPLLHLVDPAKNKSAVSVVMLVKHLHNYMMETFTERVKTSSGWRTVLLPSFETYSSYPFWKVQILESAATITPARFRVSSDFSEEDVDIHLRNCSCGAWQIFGCPCLHAREVLNQFQLNRYEYWDECYKADQYRKAYSKAVIHPLTGRLKKNKTVAEMIEFIFAEF